ncbi:uncharacterized protein [Cardiocondyla obscurior]|uniref:uncharacterized protein n=1 Tax=Cardiocondyla obscurior TaxID=286306 RepID=UPI0039657608
MTDVSTIEERYKKIQNYTEKAEKLCNYFHEAHEENIGGKCNELLYTTLTEYDKLTIAINRLQVIYGSATQKRGLIDFVGKAGKALFGLMDVDDEKQIAEQLEILHSQQQTLQHIAKNQIKILNTTIGHIRETESKMDQHIKNLANATAAVSWKIDQITRRLYALDFVSIVRILITDTLNDVHDITDFLTHSKSDMLNLRLFPLEKILAELKEAAEKLRRGNHFPFRINEQSWYNIHKYAEISAYYKGNAIITIIKLPIVGYENFEVMRVTAIPVYSGENIFNVINNDNEIIAFDKENNNYLKLTATELEKCKRSDKQYVCTQSHPIYHAKANAPCEIQALTRPDRQPTQCKTRHLLSRATIWISVHEAQSWIFSTTEEQEIQIFCLNHPRNIINIKNTGKLTIFGECQVITADISIRTKSVHESHIITRLLAYNLTLDRKNIILRNLKLKQNELQGETIISNPRELQQLTNSLDELDDKVDKVNEIPMHKILVYSTSGGTFLITITIIIIITIAIVKKYNRNKTPALPPRTLKPKAKNSAATEIEEA